MRRDCFNVRMGNVLNGSSLRVFSFIDWFKKISIDNCFGYAALFGDAAFYLSVGKLPNMVNPLKLISL